MICSFILKYNLLFITKKNDNVSMCMFHISTRLFFIFTCRYCKYIVSQNFITVSTITGKIQMLQNVHLQ